ncbi:DNA end-binding protein Ku [Pseudaminobacter salicylatoxidans]|uniref:Non-homologous end joining protein Ku n=1 Tax=Pseudaminobacter salicylatoxidans TaxID=93369 RepID=A0A316C7Y5_PSESE|nr:Ku protein [Pseudaminobacter salicylatoxidans]PWJ85568.1 DNA end-binding protein Ku [Pseudaminobacter salicylatoxidans]
MPARPAWRGYLKLSLVTCGVELSNATTSAEKVSFRIINRKTGNTVKRQYVDAESGKPIGDKDEVKGYEIEKDDYLLIEEDEIEALQIESEHTINLDGFVHKSEIDRIYLDTPYYLTPSDKVSEEAFAVIREALAEKKMAGLSRIVLYRRERPAIIEALGKGMLLTTLRYDNTVRKASAVFEEIEDVDVDEEMVDLATTVVNRRTAKFDPSKFEDSYENALLELIRAKKAGRKPPVVKAAPKESNVVNLFDALRQSLASEDGSEDDAGRKPAKRRAAKTSAGKRGSTSTKHKSA